MAHTSFINRLVKHNKKDGEKRHAHITYKKLNGRTVKRKVTPLEVRGGLMIAHDHKRDALRSFKLERIKAMEKSAFWIGFTKQAEAFSHLAEIAGLGILAAPSIQKLRGKPMKEHTASKFELAGLATLAAPAIKHLAGK